MAVLALSLPLFAQRASAAGIETLLMPGKVTKAHAKYEETCSSCHDKTDRAKQTTLCLDCHKDIATDIRTVKGFHGHMKNAGKGECRACHSEHRGREGDIVRFDPNGFDHAFTDFTLKGAHVGVACASCHKVGVAYRKADPACVACHKNDDIHKGTLGLACHTCHEPAGWAQTHFDHDTTKFGLKGAHSKIECAACHFGPRYKNTPKLCVECHTPDDVHKGSRGTDCAKCHTTDDWKSAKFDHFKETGFPLLGAHSVTPCAGCHTSGNFKDKIPKECSGCHAADDSHAGRFGKACGDCHDTKKWKGTEYDHEKKAHFLLAGAHARLSCHICHTAAVAQQKLKHECIACHRAEDPHGGAIGEDCGACHNSETWRGARFDHDLTKFPLTGLHPVVHCAQCHTSKGFKDAPTECVGCHKSDDIHKGGLGKDCSSCHSTNGWGIWEFDHGKKTHFPLVGAHKPLHCADCHHKDPGAVKLSTDCVACHQQDDVHAGQFGRQCQRCHSSVTFRGGHAN